jgi:hypothetical protein
VTGKPGSSAAGSALGEVRSADGTAIGYQRTGTGPAVVLLHGAGQSSGNLMRLARALSGAFMVYVPATRCQLDRLRLQAFSTPISLIDSPFPRDEVSAPGLHDRHGLHTVSTRSPHDLQHHPEMVDISLGGWVDAYPRRDKRFNCDRACVLRIRGVM